MGDIYNQCPHCKGSIVLNAYGELRCTMCSRSPGPQPQTEKTRRKEESSAGQTKQR